MVAMNQYVQATLVRVKSRLRARQTDHPNFTDDCRIVRDWAKQNVFDGCDETDRSARAILAGLVGGDVLPYVAP